MSAKCRTCMDDDSRYYQIDDFVDDNTTIMDMLECVVPQIHIKEEEMDFPALICEKCVDRLLTSYNFQQLCIETDRQFRQEILKPVEEIVVKTEEVEEMILLLEDEEDVKIEVYDLDEAEDSIDGGDDDVEEEQQTFNVDDKEDTIDVGEEKEDAMNVGEEKEDSVHNGDEHEDTSNDADWKEDMERANESSDFDGDSSIDDDSYDQDNDKKEDDEKENKEKKNHKDQMKGKNHDKDAEEDSRPLKIIKVHGRKRFSCGDCGKIYDRVSRIELHLHNKHKYSNKNIKIWLDEAEKLEEELAKQLELLEEQKQEQLKELTEKQLLELKDVSDTKNGTLIKVKHGDKIGFLDTSKYKIEKPKGIRQTAYTCEVCGKVVYGLIQLQRHRLVHSIHKKFICEICNRGFSNQGGLRMHRKLVHIQKKQEEKPPSPPPGVVEIFKCPSCPKIFTKRNSLAGHRRKHITKTSTDKFPCSTCGSQFSSMKNLSEHIRFRHPEITFACDQCERKFLRQEQLEHHLNAHRERVCSVCERVFTTEQSLEEHMNTHTGENPFLCPECGKSFKYSSSLQKHMDRHPGLSRFKCPECQKGCTSAKELKRHLDAHRGIKPVKRHQCDICGYRFEKLYKMKLHRRRHK